MTTPIKDLRLDGDLDANNKGLKNVDWAATDPAPHGGGSGDVATDAIWDAKGDLAVGTGANTAAKLTVGANGTVLTADSSTATGTKWAAVAGTGDVVGPSGATADRIAVFNGTTGKVIKDGGSTVANVLDRANHTGTQAHTTITGLGTAATAAATDFATAAQGTDARTPTAHASTHTNGTDDIQNATAAQKGLATAAQITKLDGIEALADVTDAANVGSAIHGAAAETTLGDTDKIPVTQSGTLKTIAYSALKTLLNALYAKVGAIGSSGLTMSTARLLGRTTASAGAVEEISVGSELSLSSGTLNGAGPLVKTLDDAATIAVDCESRNNVIAAVTVTASRALGEPSNVAVGSRVRIKWIQNGTGGYVLSAHANYVWIGGILPTMSTAANSQTWLDFEGASGNVLNHVGTIYR